MSTNEFETDKPVFVRTEFRAAISEAADGIALPSAEVVRRCAEFSARSFKGKEQ